MLQYHVSQVEKSGAQYCQHHKNNYKYALLLLNVNIETNTKPGQQLSKAQSLGSTGSGEAEGDQF